VQNGDLAGIVYLHFQEAFGKVSYQSFCKETKQVGDKKEGRAMETCLKDSTKRTIVTGQLSEQVTSAAI